MSPGRGREALGSLGPSPRRPGGLLVGAVALAILAATLWPLGAKPDFHDDHLSFRVLPADFIRNVLLFLPFGVALARRGAGLLATGLVALVFSAAIELAQLVIPGRYANGADLGGNVAGAILGAAVQRSAPHWLWPGPRGADRLALAGAGTLAAVVIGTGLLVAPALPDAEYFAGLAPELGHMARYGGRVREAALGDLPLPDGRVEGSEQLRALWLSGATLRIDAEAGPPTDSLAPLLTLHDALHREVLVLGVDGDDLVVRGRNRAQVVGLDRPSLRFANALEGTKVGAPLTITARRDGHGFCIGLGARSACPLGFTAGSGWRLLWTPQGLPAPTRDWLNGLWLAAFALPIGLWLRPTSSGATALTVAGCALLAAPLAGLLRTPSYELGAAAAGLLAGLALHAFLPGRNRGTTLLGARGAFPKP